MFINPYNNQALKKENQSLIDNQGNRFEIINGVPRFVPNDNYTASFGFQWNKFQKTQIDREQDQFNFSRERLLTVTGWNKEDLSDKNILEVGSGAGRFTKVLLEETKANK